MPRPPLHSKNLRQQVSSVIQTVSEANVDYQYYSDDESQAVSLNGLHQQFHHQPPAGHSGILNLSDDEVSTNSSTLNKIWTVNYHNDMNSTHPMSASNSTQQQFMENTQKTINQLLAKLE